MYNLANSKTDNNNNRVAARQNGFFALLRWKLAVQRGSEICANTVPAILASAYGV